MRFIPVFLLAVWMTSQTAIAATCSSFQTRSTIDGSASGDITDLDPEDPPPEPAVDVYYDSCSGESFWKHEAYAGLFRYADGEQSFYTGVDLTHLKPPDDAPFHLPAETFSYQANLVLPSMISLGDLAALVKDSFGGSLTIKNAEEVTISASFFGGADHIPHRDRYSGTISFDIFGRFKDKIVGGVFNDWEVTYNGFHADVNPIPAIGGLPALLTALGALVTVTRRRRTT